jgi:hypothetical protein
LLSTAAEDVSATPLLLRSPGLEPRDGLRLERLPRIVEGKLAVLFPYPLASPGDLRLGDERDREREADFD